MSFSPQTCRRVSDLFVKAWPRDTLWVSVKRLWRCVRTLGLFTGLHYWQMQARARRRPQDVLVWIGNLERNARCLGASSCEPDIKLAEVTREFAQELREYFIRAAGSRKGWADLLLSARRDYARGLMRTSDAVALVLHAMHLEIMARGLAGEMTEQELNEFRAAWVRAVFKPHDQTFWK